MICEYCAKTDLIEGTLEGVSFQPISESKKWLSSGIYGIKVLVCVECGRLSNFSLDNKSLKELLDKKRG
jgi:hypothetical protein